MGVTVSSTQYGVPSFWYWSSSPLKLCPAFIDARRRATVSGSVCGPSERCAGERPTPSAIVYPVSRSHAALTHVILAVASVVTTAYSLCWATMDNVSSSRAVARCSVTSVKVATAPARSSSPRLCIGRAFTDSHTIDPSPRCTPITSPSTCCPLTRARPIGCSSPEIGSSCALIARHCGCIDVCPESWSALSPRMRSALAFHATMRPSASWTTTPSASDSTMARLRASRSASSSCIRFCSAMSCMIVDIVITAPLGP